METPGSSQNDVITLGFDLLAAKRYYVGCSMLVAYDWVLTLKGEYELMWRGKKGPVFYLFLMNRYIPIFWMIVTLFAYFSPLWTFHVCDRFAIAEWVQALTISVEAELVLLFRVYALTARNKYLMTILFSLMLSQCIVVFYAMSRSGENQALPISYYDLDAYHICVLYSNPKMDTAYLSLTIAFDSLVFFTTLLITFGSSIRNQRTALHDRIRKDGTYYFFVIFSGNVLWMLLAMNGRPGVKLINAQPSMLFTSIMINRLTLSLRQAGMGREDGWSIRSFQLPPGLQSQASDRENELGRHPTDLRDIPLYVLFSSLPP